MLPKIDKIRGIHPGIILKREIKHRGLKNKELTLLVGEHAQTLSSITKQKRNITPLLSIRLGKLFDIEPEYFLLLQTYYDIEKAKILMNNPQPKPNLNKIRKALFWDTDFDKIDWLNYKKAIIKRIFERGNDEEITEIINFYGKETIKSELSKMDNVYLPTFNINKQKLLKTYENL